MSKRLNRAKCKLCGTIIVSRHRHDLVSCKCGEIFVDGGNDYWRCGAKNFKNFLRFENRKWTSIFVPEVCEKRSLFKRIISWIESFTQRNEV